MSLFEKIIAISSLATSVVSLIVSFIALRVSSRAYLFTSKDFIPDINWEIDKNDNLEIVNKSQRLFTIKQVAFLKIQLIGFENKQKKKMVQIPFITQSKMAGDFENAAKISIREDTAFACAYICSYDASLVSFVEDKIRELSNEENSNIIRYPSLQSEFFLIEVFYVDRFNQSKTLWLKKRHVHSAGYHSETTTHEDFERWLKKGDMPKFSDAASLWRYIYKKHLG